MLMKTTKNRTCMYKIIVFILGFCVLTVNANQTMPETKPETKPETRLETTPKKTAVHPNHPNPAILKLNVILEEMMPLIFDNNQFQKASTKTLIQKQVVELLTLLKNTPELPYKKSNSAQTSYPMIVAQLEQVLRAFEQKNYVKAAELLKSTSFLLINNTTLPVTENSATLQPPILSLKINRAQFSCDFAFAEYSYAIRDYQNAIIYYDKYLTAHTPRSKANIKLALERLLNLYTQIDKDPQLTATYLKEYIPYLGNDPELNALLQEWMSSLENINDYFDDELQNNHFLSFAALQNYAASLLFSNTSNENTKAIAPADKVRLVVLRGMLLNYLNETTVGAKEKPMLLYWLALCNKKLNDSAYYTFTSMLLKECFSKYPNHSYASLCKAEYEQLIQSAWLNPTDSNLN